MSHSNQFNPKIDSFPPPRAAVPRGVVVVLVICFCLVAILVTYEVIPKSQAQQFDQSQALIELQADKYMKAKQYVLAEKSKARLLQRKKTTPHF